MVDLKDKEREIKSKFKIIQQASDAKIGVENTLKQFDDTIENLQNQIGSTIDGFTSNVKKKLPNTDGVFDKICRDLDKILPKKDGQSVLRTVTRQAIKETSESIKPIFMENIRKLFFANDSEMGCGTTTKMPYSGITISPTEFDFLDILQTDPQSNLGKIVYEGSAIIPNNKVKMNKILYETFNASGYTFTSNDEIQLFTMQWNSANQKFNITGIDTSAVTVDAFITKYYESIEFPRFSDIVKNSVAMLLPIGGGSAVSVNVTNSSFDVNMNKLNRFLSKVTSYCDQKKESLRQDAIDQFSEREIDIISFFDFDDVEGIDLDDENRRYQKVLNFVDCNNYELPMNQAIIEDFAFMSTTKNDTNILNTYDDTFSKIAKEAASKNLSIPFPQFAASLDFKSILNLPKALLASIFSPKMFLPLAILWKMLKEAAITTIVKVATLLKNVFKFIYNTLKDIYNKFLSTFWKLVKPQLALIIKDLVKRILKNSKKRYKRIILALIDILTALIPFVGIKSCEDFYNAILQLLGLLRVGVKQKINGLLLQLAKRLPGYSEDRAIMNVADFLEANGIPTGDLFGEENNIVSFVSSIIKGHQKEMDQNSFVQVSLDYGQIPVAPLGGAAIIPPGVLKAHGKLT